MDKSKLFKIAKLFLQVGIYALVGIFIYMKLQDTFDKVTGSGAEITFSIPLFIASILVFSFHSIFNGLNWHFMLKSSGEQLSKMGQVELYLKSYILRYIPGNVVGIMSRAIFNKKYNVPMAKSLWGWFLENITYLTLGLMIGSFAILKVDFTDYLGAEFGRSQSTVLTVLIIIALTVGVFIIFNNDWMRVVFNKFLVPKLPQKARREFAALDISFKNRLQLVVRFLLAWAIYSLSFYLLVASFGLKFEPIYFSINAMAWSIGYLSFVTPSGTGVREAVMIFLLADGVGLSGELAVYITLLSRLVFIVGELLGFVEFYLYKLIYLKGNRNV